ncbi:MAG: hypothetical protein BGO90_11120 [Legionella sp. 40-6]|nr:hypothetical protein [Legionella sp.]OJY40227.1 MAG: hypothetical protein BGO90_11120 [Legionella sp. 40-6]
MNFDVALFQKLNEFRKHEKKSLVLLKQEAEEILQFLSTKKLNELAQFKAFNQFKHTLESIIKINNQHKSWWQWFIGLFGFISQEEKSIRHALGVSKKSLASIKYVSPMSSLIQEPKLSEQLGYERYPNQEKIKYLAHHLMGTEEFAEESKFHGMSPSDAYKHFYQDLKAFIQQYNTNDESITEEFNQVISNLEYAYILAYQLDTFFVLRKRLNDHQIRDFQENFVFNIKMKILNLMPGESFISPYVYGEDNNSGHALIIEWVKDTKGQIFANIINTGEGNEQTTSFKTELYSFFNDSERPIKKTASYELELLNTAFIDKMLEPIFSSEKPSEKMNAFFKNITLSDASEHLTLQTNGICAHACILAWFQTKIASALYSLFNVLTLEKSQQRLSALNPGNRKDNLNQLETAGQKTIENAKKQLQQQHDKKRQQLKDMGNKLTNMRKQKSAVEKPAINDYTQYISEKSNKLKEPEKEKLRSTKALVEKSVGFFSWWSAANKPKETCSPVLSKAIVAKKIRARQQFVQQAACTLGPNKQ